MIRYYMASAELVSNMSRVALLFLPVSQKLGQLMQTCFNGLFFEQKD